MRMNKRGAWTLAGIGLTALIGSLYYSGAYAYTVNNNLSAYGYVVQTSGGYALMGGDDVEVDTNLFGPFPALRGQIIHIAQEQADAGDGQGSWGVMLGDMQGANANNGYLLIADPSESPNVRDWVNRLGGNLDYVLNYLQTQNQQIQTKDDYNHTSYTYVPFSNVVNQSGAVFDPQTVSGPIGTYTDQSTGQTYPEYLYTYHIKPSAPPTAYSVTVVDANTNQSGTVKQGDQMNFTVSSNVPLWNSLATHHYVSIQAVNQSNGQSVWLVGSGTDKEQMQPEDGSQGSFPDKISSISSSSLQPGTYTIRAWVADGVDRVSNAVTTTLTVTPGAPGPYITLTANPTNLDTGDSSTLTATAVNAPSGSDTIKIIDQSGKSTLGGQNTYTANSSTSATTTATDNNAETVNYVAELLSPSGSVLATSNVVSVTWNAPQGSCPSQFVDVNQGTINSTSDTITIINRTSDPLNFSTDNPSVKLSQTSADAGMSAIITATFSGGVDSATLIITDATTNCTQTYPIYDSNYTPPTSSEITLSADPTTLEIGGSTALTATVDKVKPGAFVTIYNQTTGQYVGIGAYEKNYSLPPYWTVTMTGVDNGVVTYSGTYSTSYASNTAGSQTFVAYEWDAGVSTVGPPTAKSQPVTVTWVKPTITLSANPTSVFTGQPSQISYSTVGFASGDYVTIMGSGGQHMWTELKDTNASDSFTEIENPVDGGTTTVQYTANLYNSSGTLLSTSSVTVKWLAPTITMSANPVNNVPGQTSTISYSVNVALPPDYTVEITPNGNGADMWSASGLTSQTGTYPETEHPAAGQTITVNYTATILDPSGNPMATGGTSVSWANPWTGAISLSANPKYLATGDSTTLTATTTQAIPFGWNLVIMDQTTGQIVSSSGSAPETTQYASFTPETDTFIAFLNDGFEQVGNPSNTQTVVWSQLSLGADPLQLPAGQATTLTVTGQNVPNGDYLVIYNQTTGQEVGYSLSTPYSVQVSESIPRTDTFVAYISSNSGTSGALISSNTVSVDWYGITLTANPTQLPINNTSVLTATAANLPSGYVIDIVDQTTGQTIATGQPGQTVLNALQTKNQVETDTYVARVVQPGNPQIPGLSGAAFYTELVYGYNSTSRQLEVFNTSTGTLTPIATPSYVQGYPNTVGIPNNGVVWVQSSDGIASYKIATGAWTDYPSPVGSAVPNGYNSLTNSIIAYNSSGQFAVLNLSTGLWSSPVDHPPFGDGHMAGFTYYPPLNLVYESVHASHQGDSVDNDLYVYSFTTKTWTPIGNAGGHGDIGWLIYDPANQDVLFEGGVNLYNPYWILWDPRQSPSSPYNDISTNQAWYEYQSPSVVDTVSGNLYVNGIQASGFYSNFNSLEFTPSGQLWSLPVDMLDIAYDPYSNGLIGYYVPPNYSPWNQSNPPIVLSEYSLSSGTVTPFPGNLTPGSGFIPLTVTRTVSNDFAFWTFQNAPSYVPTSVFTQQAQAGSYGGSIWVSNSTSQPNGTVFFQSTFSLSQTQSITLSVPYVNDYAQVYVDGQPVMQSGNSGGVGGSIPNTSSATITLPAGRHQVIIEAMNNNGFASTSNNSAGVSLTVTSGGQTILSTSNPSGWTTTGYVLQLPNGWFSGAVGTWNWTEYVLQENPSQPIYQQQSYTVTTPAQNVSATSSPVSVTWFNNVTPPDNFTLQALPENVTYPAQTQFKVTFVQTDADFVNQSLGGSATVDIRIVQTWQKAVSTTWKPNSDGLSISVPYSPVPGTSLQYIALLVDKQGVVLAASNQVTVTDTGQGRVGDSYSTISCDPSGDGTEIYETYTNGELTDTKRVPLTITNLEVDGIFNPTDQLTQQYPGNQVHLPVTNEMLGYAPIPLRVQAPFAFAVKFPDAQPTKVEAVFSVNGGASVGTVDAQGDTSWTVEMHPASNLPQFWQGETIMPKLPDGVHISVTIKAYDDCGENDLVNNDFLVTADRPQWYFVQPSQP
ncbi:hypothetical protein [Alicyclobacillus macrosporangiidus]|uniref:PA14 domain-containing protein n=1 Tax=Alicyclobacillus macrosporangiidus TaxID=392015 RepID=A0A1I7KDT1_9BACL|nr:hypothetical protein [Alicyclobacillus macrosporangiidus]SFU95510.1 hypothetical protein SAMN05421543_11555 [Alicyclobacillus macrosporangiidus]